jgi:hypothetical protein
MVCGDEQIKLASVERMRQRAAALAAELGAPAARVSLAISHQGGERSRAVDDDADRRGQRADGVDDVGEPR